MIRSCKECGRTFKSDYKRGLCFECNPRSGTSSAEVTEKQRAAKRRYYEKLSPEGRKAISDQQKKYMASLSPERLAERKAKMKERSEKLSREQRAEYRQRYIAKLSPEQLQRRKEEQKIRMRSLRLKKKEQGLNNHLSQPQVELLKTLGENGSLIDLGINKGPRFMIDNIKSKVVHSTVASSLIERGFLYRDSRIGSFDIYKIAQQKFDFGSGSAK